MIRLATLALCATLATPAAACPRDAAPCTTPLGTYHVALPDAASAPTPAVMVLHGAGGTGRGILGMRGMVQALTARGYAVIAPDGLPWRSGRTGGIWAFYPDRRDRRDEAAFFASVTADAAARHNIDPSRVILAGFSAGGFMVTYLACEQPGAFHAYAPIAGGFWRPQPTTCAGPTRLFHTHGWRDSTVPLEGRALRAGFLQGDIFEGLTTFRAANRCTTAAPTGYSETGDYQRRRWDGCAPGSALELALHPGGHGIPQGWADMMLDWAEALPPR